MDRVGLQKIFIFGVLVAATLVLLAACERPDPQDSAASAPTLTPTTEATQTIQATQPPVQVYVVVIQPTPEATQIGTNDVSIAAPTITTAQLELKPTPTGIPEPTALPENFFLGWAWNDSLTSEASRITVDEIGIILRDRPSQTGEQVGIVMGFAEVIQVGRDRCGYTPVLVHASNLLTRTTPHPEVWSPDPLPTEAPPFAPTPYPVGNATAGWAFTEALTILGETAITGPLGINLRTDPCRGATNLGFIPAGSNIIVVGPANDQYTPVRVSNALLQVPVEPLELVSPDDNTELPVLKAAQKQASPPESISDEFIAPTIVPAMTETSVAESTPIPTSTPEP
jgi:hypothetical protein